MPTVSLSLDWLGELSFRNAPGFPAMELHSSKKGMTSPPQALGYAVMACMAMDVVHVIQKGRYDMRGMRIDFTGERAGEHPRRYLSMRLHFEIIGAVPDHIVSRAIDLSRDKYCSVWNTIRPDVVLTTTFAVHE